MTGTAVRTSTARTLVRAGAAGQVLFAVVFLVEDATRRGFQPWRQWVSHLSLGPWGWVNIAALAVAGAGAVLAAVGVARLLPAGRARWLPRAIGAYGGALVLAAVCPIDPGLGWPTGQPPAHTLTGGLHQLAGATIFGGLTVAAWAGRRLAASGQAGARWARWSAVTGVTVPASFLLCGILAGLDYSGAWPDAPSGLFERLALLAGTAWLTAFLAHLAAGPSGPAPNAGRP
ncbi:DUF998 domain-containing protein [Solihabitans fulvus]|uniref:DUF998 domain-containing protein n=1 Tax=Solihabitans fulvus TaxID=1892852 RepID=UPI001661D36B|nr:DUF998 domain-containing protein [Solihabitans fulvus]